MNRACWDELLVGLRYNTGRIDKMLALDYAAVQMVMAGTVAGAT